MQFDFFSKKVLSMRRNIFFIAILAALTLTSCKDDFHVWKDTNEKWLVDNRPMIDSMATAADKNGYQRAGVTQSGIQFIVYHEGFGATPKRNSQVVLTYHNNLIDNTVVGTVESGAFDMAELPIGWQEMMCDRGLKQGANFKIFVPWNLAFGKNGNKLASAARYFIPPYSTLISTIQIVDVMNIQPK